jgi:hypothetical protein
MAISVVVAVGNAADRLVPLMKERIAKLRVGDGLEPTSEMGPLINKAHRDKVAGYVDKGVSEGATLVSDGRTLQVAGRPAGFFLGPCLFDNVKPSMAIYKDEIFGPVLPRARRHLRLERSAREHEPVCQQVAFTNDGSAALPARGRVGMWSINVPRCRGSYSFGGKGLAVRRPPLYPARAFYTRMKAVARWPDPSQRRPRPQTSSSAAHSFLARARLDPSLRLGVAVLAFGDRLLARARRLRRDGGARSSIEDLAAPAAAKRAFLVADEIDEEHAEVLGQLDLAKRRALAALGAGLDEALAIAHGPGLRVPVEQEPHGAATLLGVPGRKQRLSRAGYVRDMLRHLIVIVVLGCGGSTVSPAPPNNTVPASPVARELPRSSGEAER